MPLRIRPVAFSTKQIPGKEFPGLAVYHEEALAAVSPAPFMVLPGYATSVTDVIFEWATLKVIADGGIVIGESFQAVLSKRPDGKEIEHNIRKP